MTSESSSPLRVIRTSRAWQLLPHPQAMGRKAHALLLLANGRRSLGELSLLLGGNILPLIEKLMQQGLLQPAPNEAFGSP
ncbi:MAG: hypothetical protein R3E94_00645 [Burkholderiaceae bacterium]